MNTGGERRSERKKKKAGETNEEMPGETNVDKRLPADLGEHVEPKKWLLGQLEHVLEGRSGI